MQRKRVIALTLTSKIWPLLQEELVLGCKEPLSKKKKKSEKRGKKWGRKGEKGKRDIKVFLSCCLMKAALTSCTILQDIFDVNHIVVGHAFSPQSSLYFDVLLHKEESTWGHFLVISPGHF